MTGAATLPDTIGTVRLRGPDTPAARMAVRGTIERLHWRHEGDTTHAILLVRRLEGVFDTGSPDRTRRLEARLRDEIDRCRRIAVPLDGRAIPPSTEAVVARDLIELLARLLVDRADGVVTEHWWWRAVRRYVDVDLDPVRILTGHASIAPAVIVEIARGQGRPDVVDRLSDAQAIQVLEALIERHGIRRPEHAFGASPRSDAMSGADRWSALIGPAPGLPSGVAARVLHEVARRIIDDPPSTRAAGFLPALIDLIVPTPGSNADEHDRSRRREPPAGAPTPDRPHGVEFEPVDTARTDGARIEGDLEERASLTTHHGSAQVVPMVVHRELAAGHPVAAPPASTAINPADPRPDPSVGKDEEPEQREPHDVASREPADLSGIRTDLGGVFFLVELMRELDLPDVFEAPCRLASTVGAWGTLDLVARGLLPADAEYARDPIWGVLGLLAGGDGAGGGVERARRLSARGIATIPPSWPAATHTGRSSGLSIHGGPTLAAGVHLGGRRWLATVVPAVRSLLCDRLRCSTDDLIQVLLLRPAFVEHDRTHVDVHLPLATASVAVRRAGLDRDPGWLPTFERVIAFHFDDVIPGGPR